MKAKVERIHIVYFFCDALMTIDCSLENQNWHGISVAFVCGEMYIENDCKIHVSGKDGAVRVSPAENGREPGEDGKVGEPGFAGESSGSVLICTSRVFGKTLEIFANGGNGGDGQNGGNGANGTNGDDGVGLQINELKEKFPCVLYHFSPAKTRRNVLASLQNLLSLNTDQGVIWFDENTYASVSDVLTAIKRSSILWSFYIKGEIDGCKVTLSYYGRTAFQRHCILLYEGACGQKGLKGGKGGEGGKGGLGGREGKVNFYDLDGKIIEYFDNVKTLPYYAGKKGKNGTSGKGGKNGVDGKKADDVCYATSLAKQHKFQVKKLIWENMSNATSDSLWCHYLKQYVVIKPDTNYTEIVQSTDERRQEKATRPTQVEKSISNEIEYSTIKKKAFEISKKVKIKNNAGRG